MKLVLISDTHNRQIKVPNGDVMVHAGDLTGRGSLNEVAKTAAWLRSLPHRYKVVIAGNHDYAFQRQPEQARALMDGLVYLEETSVEIEGVKFFGSPWTPWFYDWAFNAHRGDEIKQHWDRIPEGTDVLITHGPAFGMLDQVQSDERVGCEDLLTAIERVRPKLHVFGHIHESYGIKGWHGPTIFANASTCDLRYSPVNPPLVVDL